MKRKAATARIDSSWAAVADWAEPLGRPSAELQPYKWYRIFLVVYGFWYARDLYQVVRYFIVTRSILFEEFIFVGTALAFDTLLFVLIIKKRKWGWILLVVEHTYMIFINLTLYVEMQHFNLLHVNAMPNLYTAFFHLAIVAFLWRRTMAEFFGVGLVVKRRSLGVGLGIGLIIGCISWFQ